MQPGSKSLGQAVEQGNRGLELAPFGGRVLISQRCDHGVDDSGFPVYQQLPADVGDRYSHAAAVFLAAGSFQHPENFSDVMTALFGPDSAIADALLNHGGCVLEFEAYAQAYRVPCRVVELATRDSFFQATYWHNRMFNPNMPPGVRVLSFAPDWKHAAGWRVDSD